jgi:hypothetical protein
MTERLTSFAKPPRTAYARARHVRCRDPRLPSRNGAVVVRSGQWGAKSASTLPCGRRCRAGIQRGPDALQASDAQQQIQPKDEDKPQLTDPPFAREKYRHRGGSAQTARGLQQPPLQRRRRPDARLAKIAGPAATACGQMAAAPLGVIQIVAIFDGGCPGSPLRGRPAHHSQARSSAPA